jgi:CheY-like chemotaxis protein
MSESTSPRVLIVEDETITARDLRHCLESLNYEVCGIAITGNEAVYLANQTQPDLVLMDIRLQGEMNGIEAAGMIYQQLCIPVVFLTAFSDEETLQNALQIIPFGYLTKPFELATLKTTVQVALARHRHESKVQNDLTTSEALRAKITESSEARSRYLSLMSHEFRTPLSSILLSSTILEKYSQGWTEEKKQVHLQRITSAGTHGSLIFREGRQIVDQGGYKSQSRDSATAKFVVVED